MAKAVIILDKQETLERAQFWNEVASMNTENFSITCITQNDKITEYIDSISSINNTAPFVIFAHNSDIEAIEKRSVMISACNLKNIALVLYSGGNTGVFILNSLLLDNLHISVLKENIENFLSCTKEETLLTGEKLGLLVAIDPILETFLTPFATYHPLGALPADLKVKKIELQSYVNTKLEK